MAFNGQDRIPGKQKQIVEALRTEIVTGAFRPGGQMPTQHELVMRFGVSGMTVQHALGELVREGFLCTLPRRGTYVASDPPHLCHYGVIFHTSPSQSARWPQFWAALEREAGAMQQAGDRLLTMFYGIHGWTPGVDYQRLMEQVSRHQLAGLIFTSDPHHLVGTPLLTEPNIPRVAVAGPHCYPGVVCMRLDHDSFWQRVVELVHRRNGRLGVLTTPTYPTEALAKFLCERGVELRPEHIQAVSLDGAEWARNAAQLMMLLDRRRRPDVLVVADDNLVPYATAGIAASGVSVPGDVEVIAHCNSPWPMHSSVPVRRIGYDVRAILKACVDVIDAKRAGRAVPESVTIQATWQEELDGVPASGAGVQAGEVSEASGIASDAGRAGV